MELIKLTYFYILSTLVISTILFAQNPDSSKSEFKKIEISGGLFKTYKVDGSKIKDVKELEKILSNAGDSKVNESFSTAKNWNSIGQVFAMAGGGLIGYSLGGTLGGKKLNKPFIGIGLGGIAIATILTIQAEKHGKSAVDRYNALVDEKNR